MIIYFCYTKLRFLFSFFQKFRPALFEILFGQFISILGSIFLLCFLLNSKVRFLQINENFSSLQRDIKKEIELACTTISFLILPIFFEYNLSRKEPSQSNFWQEIPVMVAEIEEEKKYDDQKSL